MASRGEARPAAAAGDVLGPAWSLRWRAPELALVFAERAGALAKLAGDGPDRLRAEATVVVASCRLGQRLHVVERAIDAVRLAERQKDGAMAATLRVELAGCARTAGVPLVGAAVLRPVLTADGVAAATRADALVQMAGCLRQLANASVIDEALAEADRLYADDRDLDPDERVVLRALLRSVASGEQRRRGDARAAVQAAQEGADLLASVHRPSSDNGAASARVALRLVHGLLDLGWVDEATVVAGNELAKPVRAPAASAIGWLSLAVAVRHHLAAGASQPALALIRQAAVLAERHRLAALRAEALTTQSDAHERVGQLAEALDCLRTAQGVRLRRARAVYAARTKLVSAFGETTSPAEFVELLGNRAGRRAAGARAVERAAEQSAASGRFGMRHPLAAAVTGARAATPGAAPNTDVTMVLVDVTTAERAAGGGALIGEQVVSQVLDRVRDAAPDDAQVARVGGAEFAVLLPTTQAGQTAHWVEQLRGAMATVDWSSYTPSLAVNVRVAVAQQQSGRRTQEPTRTAAAHPPATVTPMPRPTATPAATSAVPAPAAASRSADIGASPSAMAAESPSATEPSSATEPPSSVFEAPTVPLSTVGSGRRSRSEQGAIGSPDAQDALAKAMEQWRQTKGGQTEGARRATPEPAQPSTPAAHPAAQTAQPATQSGGQSAVPAGQSAVSAGPSTTGSWSVGGFSEPPTNPRLRRPGTHATAQPPAVPESVRASEHTGPLPAIGHLPLLGDPTAEPADAAQPAASAGRLSQHGDGSVTQSGGSPAAPPILPALPILPPLEPEHPVSTSSVFQTSESAVARTPAIHDPSDALSSDPSVRISASDISAAFAQLEPQAAATPDQDEPARTGAEPARRRHPDLDAPGLDMWMPGLPPSELTMPWPVPSGDTTGTTTVGDPYRSPFADSPFTDPIGDPNEPSRPRHAVDADAGRSVLSSLGITTGSGGGGGGRRRAKEDPTDERRPEPRTEAATPVEPAPRIVSFDDIDHLEPLPPTAAPAPEPAAAEPTTAEPAAPEPPRPDATRPDDGPVGDGTWVPLRYRRHELPVPPSPMAAQPVPVPPPADPADTVDKPARPDVARAPEQPRAGGKRRRSVQLADLLTEALMAYQTAQDTNEARQNPLGQEQSLPGPTSLPAPLAGSVGLDPAVGDEPGYAGPARHRGDTHLGDSRWHTTRWDPTDDLT